MITVDPDDFTSALYQRLRAADPLLAALVDEDDDDTAITYTVRPAVHSGPANMVLISNPPATDSTWTPEPDPFYVDPTGEGLTLADCPHRPGTPEANEWARAWGHAEANRRQADGTFGASQLDRARACKLASGVEDGGGRVFGRGYLEPGLAYPDDRAALHASALVSAFASAAGAMQSFAVHAAAVDRILKAGALGAFSVASWNLGPPVDPTYTPPPPASRLPPGSPRPP